MKLEEAKEYLRNLIKNDDTMDEVKALSYFYGVEAIETVLQEIEHLQKENCGKDCLIETLDHNEKVKDEYIKHLEDKIRNNISKDKIREKIEKLNADNEQDTEIVKRYEEMRRNSQDSFYRNSYQKSIHELNTKRSMRKIFISILQELLKEE